MQRGLDGFVHGTRDASFNGLAYETIRDGLRSQLLYIGGSLWDVLYVYNIAFAKYYNDGRSP